MESVVSMYEDRFDLWTLQSHPTAEPSKRHTENSWWKRFIRKKAQAVSSALYFVVIGSSLLPVKRTKELRALTGWYVLYLCIHACHKSVITRWRRDVWFLDLVIRLKKRSNLPLGLQSLS